MGEPTKIPPSTIATTSTEATPEADKNASQGRASSVTTAGVQPAPTGVVGPSPDEQLADELGKPTGRLTSPLSRAPRPSAENAYRARTYVEDGMKKAFASVLPSDAGSHSYNVKGTAVFDPTSGRLMYILFDKEQTNLPPENQKSFQSRVRNQIQYPSFEGMEIKYNTIKGEGSNVKTPVSVDIPFHVTTT